MLSVKRGCAGSEDLLQEGLAGGDPELRLLAARALGRLGSGASLPALMQALGDMEEEVCEGAMQSLIELSRQYPADILQLLQSRL